MKNPDILSILKAMSDPGRKGCRATNEKPGKDKPNCYKCKYRKEIMGDAHSECTNREANVEGYAYGIHRGWFFWPYNFDPVWLVSCNGFEGRN